MDKVIGKEFKPDEFMVNAAMRHRLNTESIKIYPDKRGTGLYLSETSVDISEIHYKAKTPHIVGF